MSITITHPFVSAIADDPVAAAAGEVVPSNWNAAHTIIGIDSPSQIYVTESGTIGTKLSAIAAASSLPATTDSIVTVIGGADKLLSFQQAFQGLVLQGLRVVLKANTTIYLSPTGNDSVPYVAMSIGNPWATLNKAWSFICSTFDLAGFTVTIQMADGTYSGLQVGAAVGGLSGTPNGGGNIVFQGNTGDYTKVIISDANNPFAFGAMITSALTFSYLTLNGTGGTNYLINVQAPCVVNIKGTIGCRVVGAYALSVYGGGAQINLIGCTINFDGSPTYLGAIIAQAGGLISIFNNTGLNTFAVPSGTLTIATGFAIAVGAGQIETAAAAFSGSVSGPRYDVEANGVINTFGSGASYWPGTSVGTASTGGQYI